MKETVVNQAQIGFYPVYSFMECELKLRCNTLRVYAILFSYTNGSAGMYYGTRNYLADSLRINVRTLRRALTQLFERHLIENAFDVQSGRSGIRCSFVHESERGYSGAESADGKFVFGEAEKTKALDNLVKKKYGELPERLHIAVRAALRDNMERRVRAKEVNEAAKRITRNIAEQ